MCGNLFQMSQREGFGFHFVIVYGGRAMGIDKADVLEGCSCLLHGLADSEKAVSYTHLGECSTPSLTYRFGGLPDFFTRQVVGKEWNEVAEEFYILRKTKLSFYRFDHESVSYTHLSEIPVHYNEHG